MSFLTHQVDGAPLWAWLVMLLFSVVFPLANEYVARTRNISAQTMLQLFGRMLLALPVFQFGRLGGILKAVGNVPAPLFPVPPEEIQTDPGHKRGGQ